MTTCPTVGLVLPSQQPLPEPARAPPLSPVQLAELPVKLQQLKGQRLARRWAPKAVRNHQQGLHALPLSTQNCLFSHCLLHGNLLRTLSSSCPHTHHQLMLSHQHHLSMHHCQAVASHPNIYSRRRACSCSKLATRTGGMKQQKARILTWQGHKEPSAAALCGRMRSTCHAATQRQMLCMTPPSLHAFPWWPPGPGHAEPGHPPTSILFAGIARLMLQKC